MKKYLVGIALLMVAACAQTPFSPELEDRFVNLEETAGYTSSAISEQAEVQYILEGHHAQRLTKVTYDVSGAVDSGATGTHGLGVYLPAKAIIQRSWYEVVTQFVDSGTGTMQISCEDAGNILATADITGVAAAGIRDGVSSGPASGFQNAIAADCEVSINPQGVAATAGKLNLYIQWAIGQ